MVELYGYDPWLVGLSFVMAFLASLMALDLAGRLRETDGLASYAWLGGGAFAMGAGIWAMHFIGMLALHTAMPMRYDMAITLGSLLASILASALALALVRTPRLSAMRLVVGGGVMGGGICLMHYMGMQAMQLERPISYRPDLVMLSVVVAIVAATGALWLFSRLNPHDVHQRAPWSVRCLAALLMAMAVTGMHYIGMAAGDRVVMPLSSHEPAFSAIEISVAIAIVVASILLLALLMAIYDGHLAAKNALLAASLKEANQELQSLAMVDVLTRLPNRLFLEQRLREVLERAERTKQPFSVLFVNLDRFKTVNDSLGHHIGDTLIRRTAQRLVDTVRDQDAVARVGGDEFMIVTGEGTCRRGSETLAQRIVRSLAEPFQIDEQVVWITCSVGISCYPGHGSTAHELMTHADAAMYHAKNMGRSNCQCYEPGLSSVAERRNQLERRLRQTLTDDSLSLAYQPKVDVLSGEITGVEALLRWHDEELGQVTPDEIIPVAEETGLILPVGEWVLRTACQQVQRWHARGMAMLPVAVNLSAIQLNNPHFVGVVERVLLETQLPAGYLEFELTESAIMQNPDNALRILLRLRKLGVMLSIDDFGTGYSNLSQLKRFPINRLKIDRSFTAGVTSDPQDAAIVKAVSMLAHSLDLDIVAEGVETDEQLAFIRELKGQQYQGYLCSKALPATELERFLRARAPLTA
ncbi:putative bifunctional diguanylate cyclase/phosphodiesterase [Modicisalibacter radicis]|uniref:putative bifunctional diguanylate cyclase/phosphodiesterase n=1 Tax=Halomonas sp. EAR18 TaxID=2518972 RepID=UPI00109C1776|nr:EAL domain-containing protein [Halomonas sp. EAR18]